VKTRSIITEPRTRPTSSRLCVFALETEMAGKKILAIREPRLPQPGEPHVDAGLGLPAAGKRPSFATAGPGPRPIRMTPAARGTSRQGQHADLSMMIAKIGIAAVE